MPNFMKIRQVGTKTQVITVCQDIADSLDNGDKIDFIIVDFSKAF
jgi:hypothetical protein